MSVSVTPGNIPATQTAEPATTTPEIFIALTQAVPGEFQPTDLPAPTVTPVEPVKPVETPAATQPPVNAGTSVTYSPLTIIIPQEIASGTSDLTFPRVDSDDAAWWEKTPGHLQVNLGGYCTLQGKTHQPAIYVYPALGCAELASTAFESIHRLQNYLYAPNNVLAPDQLPGVPFFNAQILFAAHIQPLSF
ncbi:MAG: hypothetical protein ACOYYS_23245 [Chloroflexota bacterium]